MSKSRRSKVASTSWVSLFMGGRKGEGEREREGERETDRQRERERDRQTDRQREKEILAV